MKICHVINDVDPLWGGPPKIAVSLAAAQAVHGHDVTLVAHDTPERAADVQAMMDAIPGVEPRVRMDLIHPHLGLKWWNPIAAGARLNAPIGWADFVHIHCVWDWIQPAAAAAARRLGTPYCQLLNGMLDPWTLAQKPIRKKIALALAYRRMLNGEAFIHLGNTDEQELIRPLGLKSPGVIIPNGVFMEEVEPLPAPGDFRREHPWLGDRPFVLFMGRLHYKKGLDHLAGSFARVAREHPDAQLVVAGPDEGGRADFERRVAGAGCAERVHVVGPIYGPAKFAAMVDAACFCLPSRQEGFSVAITEALACGLPCVVTEGCHYPAVRGADAGRVVPLDDRAVADALLEVLGDADLRERMSRNASRLVRENFTWPRIAEMAVGAYRDAIERRSAAAAG